MFFVLQSCLFYGALLRAWGILASVASSPCLWLIIDSCFLLIVVIVHKILLLYMFLCTLSVHIKSVCLAEVYPWKDQLCIGLKPSFSKNELYDFVPTFYYNLENFFSVLINYSF